MDYFPVFLDVKSRRCLLVGGGDIATRKGRLLARAGARLCVVAPEISAELQTLAEQGGGEWHLRSYRHDDLDQVVLVCAATDDYALNERISQEAQDRYLPTNVVDSPALCSFITPAIVDRSPLVVAISSGGEAPVLARSMRARLETLIPQQYGQLAQLASRWRERVKQALPEADRRRFWEKVLQGPIAEQVFSGRVAQAEEAMTEALDAQDFVDTRGEVYLVGAGPGDPELLTLKALRLMQQADVVLYDRLVSPRVMELVRRDADRIYVGKRRHEHSMPQENINELLLKLAQEGKRVLRLKGGDPFIFGRGGEEIDRLAQHGIPFQVVPGITAASGCAAYAGIPLTHRDYSQSVRFITAHLKTDNPNLSWPELALPGQTLVFYMSLIGLSDICQTLIQHGRGESTPAALVEKGTLSEQRVLTGTLADLPKQVAESEVHGPTLLIVGEVVQLHRHLGWFRPGENDSQKTDDSED